MRNALIILMSFSVLSCMQSAGYNEVSQNTAEPILSHETLQRETTGPKKTTQFIGFMCLINEEYTLIDTRYLDANPQAPDVLYLMPCPPADLGVAFSHPVKHTLPEGHSKPMTSSTKLAPLDKPLNVQFDWLKGPEYRFTAAIEEENMFIYGLILQSFARYTLDLSKVRFFAQDIPSNKQRTIQFVTQETASDAPANSTNVN